MTAAASPYRLTPNLFGIGFGIAGLAQVWAVAADTVGAASWPADALWILAAAVWLLTLVAYVRNLTAQGRLRTELPDPILGPFTALWMTISRCCWGWPWPRTPGPRARSSTPSRSC